MLVSFFYLPSRLFLLFALLGTTFADRNVTVDDSDSSITYSPGWSVSPAGNSLNYGGSHHLTDDKSGTATFKFTGTAVYVMAPLWPYKVGGQASVDGSRPETVDMQDHSHTTDGGSEDVASAVVWGKTGLSNSSHTLRITFWNDMDYLALDAIIYTVPDSSASGTSSASTSTSTNKKSNSSSSGSNSNHTTTIIIGAVIGAAFLALLAVLAVILRRRRRDRNGGPSRTFEGKSYVETHPDSPNLVPVPLGSGDSFGNSGVLSPPVNQTHSSISPYTPQYYGHAEPAGAGRLAYGASVPGKGRAGPAYGHNSTFTGYNPWDRPGSQATSGISDSMGSRAGSSSNPDSSYFPSPNDSQTALHVRSDSFGSAPAGSMLLTPDTGSSNPSQDRNGSYGLANAGPSQIVLSYGSPSAGPSSGDVYTSQPLDATEEKRRLAETYTEPPPRYS